MQQLELILQHVKNNHAWTM